MTNNSDGPEKQEGLPKPTDRRVRMASERTFLAWVRTAIAIMAFGFIVERSVFFGPAQSPSPGLSQVAGLLLIAFGVLIMAVAFIRYRSIEKEFDQGTYHPNIFHAKVLTVIVIASGLLLIVYLIRSL